MLIKKNWLSLVINKHYNGHFIIKLVMGSVLTSAYFMMPEQNCLTR